MRRGVIRIGDPLTSGGQVVSACSNFKVDGKEVAGVGDACHCSRHGDVQIVEGIETFTFFGKKLALHGCKVSCGCSVISTTELMVVDTGEGETSPKKQDPPALTDTVQTGTGGGGVLGMMLGSALMGAVGNGGGGPITLIDATGGDYLKTIQGTDTGLQKIISDNNVKVESVATEAALRDAASSANPKGTTILVAHTKLDPANPSGTPLGIMVGSLFGGPLTLTGISASNPLAISGRGVMVVGCGAENPGAGQFFSFTTSRAYGITARAENGGLNIGMRAAISAAYNYLSQGRSIPSSKMSYDWEGRSISFGAWPQ